MIWYPSKYTHNKTGIVYQTVQRVFNKSKEDNDKEMVLYIKPTIEPGLLETYVINSDEFEEKFERVFEDV